MADNEALSLVGIKYQSTGAAQAATDAKNVTAGLDGVSVAQDKTTKATTSAANSLERLQKSYDSTYRALTQQQKALSDLDKAHGQGLVSDQRRAELTGLINQRYKEATQATGQFAAQAGLARHELINLSRQAQDVVVSLQGGQGLGTVMLQQGSQIIDVLGTSRGGIGGAVSSLATSFRNLFTVGRVAFAGIATAVGGAAYATGSYLSEQKSLERSLIGNRMASPGAINRIGNQQSSATGLSIGETREAALEFAKTGQIHSRVIGEMIETTKNFALVTGQSSKEAAAALAGAFTNMQGIDQLNKQFNFLDAGTRGYIESLLLAGRTTEAAAVANRSLAVVLKEVESTQGGLEKGWTAIGNAISNVTSKLGEYIAKSAGLQRKSKLDSAAEIAGEIEGLQSRVNRGDFNNALGDTTNLDRVTAQIENLRGKLRELHGELGSIDGSNFNALSIGAQQAINALNPFRAKIAEVEGALQRIKALQAEGVLNPELQQAVTQYDLILQNLKNQETALESLRSKHAGMTDTFAKQVESLEQQNRLLKARANGTEASVSAAIAYENAIAAGANSTEAAAIKSLTLKNNLMQAASAASNISLQLGSSEWDFSEADAYIARGGHSPGSGGFLGDQPLEMNQSGAFPTDVKGWMKAFDFITKWTNESGGSRINFGQQFAAMNNAEAQFLGGSSNNQDKIKGLQMQIEALYPTLGEHPENIWQIRSLQRSMEDLMKSVDENTAALNKVTLNPLYTEGRSALKVGYIPKSANGFSGIINSGPSSGDKVLFQSWVNRGEQVDIKPVATTNDNRNTPVVNNTFNIIETGSKNRRSSRQLAQRYGAQMAALN